MTRGGGNVVAEFDNALKGQKITGRGEAPATESSVSIAPKVRQSLSFCRPFRATLRIASFAGASPLPVL